MESCTVRENEFDSIKRRCKTSSLSSDDTPSSQLNILEDQQDGKKLSEACKSIRSSGIGASDASISADYMQKSESINDRMSNPVNTTGVDIRLPSLENDVYHYFHGFDVAEVECIEHKGALAFLTGSNVVPTKSRADASFHGFQSGDEALSELSDFEESGCEAETQLSIISLTIATKAPDFVETTVTHTIATKASDSVEISKSNTKLRKAKSIAKKHRKKRLHKKAKIFPSKRRLHEKIRFSECHNGLEPISSLNLSMVLSKSTITLEIEKANASQQESRLQDALKEACESFFPPVLVDTTNLLPDSNSQTFVEEICSSPIKERYISSIKNTLSRTKSVTEESALDLALGDVMVHWLTTGQVNTVYDASLPNCISESVSHCNIEPDNASKELVIKCNPEMDNEGKKRLDGKEQSDQNKEQSTAGGAIEDSSSYPKTSMVALSQSDGTSMNSQCFKAALYLTASARDEFLQEVPYSCQLKLRLDPTQPQPLGTITNVFHKAFLSTKENSTDECFSDTYLNYTSRVNKAIDHESRRLEKILTAQTSEHPDMKTPTSNFIYEPVKKRPKLMTSKRAIADDLPERNCCIPSISLPGSSHSQCFSEKIPSASKEDKNSSCSARNKQRSNSKRMPMYDQRQVAACRAKLKLKINLPSSSYRSLSDHFVMDAESLEQPYLYGFYRSVVFRNYVKSSSMCDIYYYPANGKIKMRSVHDVNKYIDAHPYLASNLSSSNFDFHKGQHNVGLPYEIVRPASALHWKVRRAINDEDPVDAFDFAGFLNNSKSANDFEGFNQIESTISPNKLWLKNNDEVKEPREHSGYPTECNGTNINETSHGSRSSSDCQRDIRMDRGLSESLGEQNNESRSAVHDLESSGRLNTLKRKSVILSKLLAANFPKKLKIAESEVTTLSHSAHLRTHKQLWRQPFCRPLPLPEKSEPPTMQAIFGCTLTPEKEQNPENGVPHSTTLTEQQFVTCSESNNKSRLIGLGHCETPIRPIKKQNNIMVNNPMPEMQCKFEPEPFETGDYYLSCSSPKLQTMREEHTKDGSVRLYSSEPQAVREEHAEDGSERAYSSSELQAVRVQHTEDGSERAFSPSEPQTVREEHTEYASMLPYLSSGDDGDQASSPYEFIPVGGPFCSTSLPIPIGWVRESEAALSYAGPKATNPINVQPSLVDVPTDTNSEQMFLIFEGRSRPHFGENERPQVKGEEQLFDTDSYISEDDEEIDVLNLTSSPSKYSKVIRGNGSYSEQSLEGTRLYRSNPAQEQEAPHNPTQHPAEKEQCCVSSCDPTQHWSSWPQLSLPPCQMVGVPTPDTSLRRIVPAVGHEHQPTQSDATSPNSSFQINVKDEQPDRSLSPRSAASTVMRSTLMSEFVRCQHVQPALPSSPVMPLDLCTTRPPSLSSSSSPSQLVNDFVRENLVINCPNLNIASTPPPDVVSALRHQYSFAGAPACLSGFNAATSFGTAGDLPRPYGSPDRQVAHALGSGVLVGRPSAGGVLPSVGSSGLMTGGGQ